MKILFIAGKDLTQILRDRKTAVFLLALPILFTLLMGLAFNTNSETDLRLPVGVVSENSDTAAEYLSALLASSPTVRPVDVEYAPAEQLAQTMRSMHLSAIVLIPAGFDRDALNNRTPQLIVTADLEKTSGKAADRAIQLAATRLMGSYRAALLAAETAGIEPGDSDWENLVRASMEQAIKIWEDPQVEFSIQWAGSGVLPDPSLAGSGFQQASTGMLVFFILVGMITPSAVVLAERRARTLSRMRILSLADTEMIAGHLLAMFIVCFAQILTLALFGQWAMGVEYWRDPYALIATAVGMALFSASFGLLLGVTARNDSAVMLAAMGCALAFGMLGGCFFPLDLADRSFAAIGQMLPSAWALEALRNISLRGSGVEDVLDPIAKMLAATIAMGALALWRFAVSEKK